MSATFTDVLMALGQGSVDVDWDPEVWAAVLEGAHLQVYEGARLDQTLVIVNPSPGRGGLVLPLRSLEHHLGVDNIGPIVEDRWYYSGHSRLSDGGFEAGLLYWRTGEGSEWEPHAVTVRTGAGSARHDGSTDKNDPLVSAESWPVEEGDQWRQSVYVRRTSGTVGRIVNRTVLTGRFDHPQLLLNANLEGGGTDWGTSPSIDVVNDPSNARSGSWVMRIGAIPKPQLLSDPGLETGTGWTLTAGEPGDIAIVNDPAEARTGDYVMRVGPSTRKQRIINWNFETPAVGVPTLISAATPPVYWYENTELADPSNEWYLDPGGGLFGAQALTTAGVAAGVGVPEEKYVRAQFDGSAGVVPGVVEPGESFELEVWVRAASSTDGKAWISAMIPHPTVPAHDQWYASQALIGDQTTADQWNRLTTEISVPPNRFALNVVLTVFGHHAGFWAWDDVTLTRTRGNRAQFACDTTEAVVAGTRYDLTAYVRSDDTNTGGSVRIGVILTGPSVDPQVVDVEQGHTDFVWTTLTASITVPDGYDTAQPFVASLDVVGGPMFVDDLALTKMDHNEERLDGTAFTVTGERSYRWLSSIRSDAELQRGKLRLSVHLFGPGRPDIRMESSDMEGTDDTWKLLDLSFTPPSGYNLVYPSVVAIDTEGPAYFWVDDLSITDSDPTTLWLDSYSAASAGAFTEVAHDITAPRGAKTIHAEIVTESQGDGWVVDDVSLTRIGVTISDGEDVVGDCLVHPETSLPLLEPGTLHAAGPIAADWHVLNMTNRQVLQHLSRVGQVNPAREWYVGADGSLHWGLPEDLFCDHNGVVSATNPSGSMIVLGPDEFLMLGAAEVTANTECITDLKVIGATNGDVQIVGRATNPAGTALDYMGNPVQRMQVVEDSTVDQIAIADPYAEYLASKSQGTANVKVTLSDPRVLGRISKGDWIYLWDGELLVDDTYELPLPDGRRCNPVRRRVLAITQRFGGGAWSAKLRRPGGSLVEIAPRWESETTVELELGEMLPEFAVGPEAGSSSMAFLKYRVSTPTR